MGLGRGLGGVIGSGIETCGYVVYLRGELLSNKPLESLNNLIHDWTGQRYMMF